MVVGVPLQLCLCSQTPHPSSDPGPHLQVLDTPLLPSHAQCHGSVLPRPLLCPGVCPIPLQVHLSPLTPRLQDLPPQWPSSQPPPSTPGLPSTDPGFRSPVGFFLLGGLCVVWGGASYVVGLASLRAPMQLSLGGAAAGVGAVLAAGLLWACAVGLYMGQLELDVELVPEDDGTAAAEGPDEAGRPPPE